MRCVAMGRCGPAAETRPDQADDNSDDDRPWIALHRPAPN